jgi:RNA polymerase sigma-70 factor, ECF subfamily
MQESPDIDLVLKARKGDKEAFANLYHRYKARILNYLAGYINDVHAAQDLTQDTFINAYRNIETLMKMERFSSWLYTIATNLAKNYLIAKSRVKQESLEKPISQDGELTLSDVIGDTEKQPDKEMDRKILEEDIQTALYALPPIYKEVLLLCDVDCLSYEEAAEILNCNIGTIGSRLNEARRKFRDIFRSMRGAVKP